MTVQGYLKMSVWRNSLGGFSVVKLNSEGQVKVKLDYRPYVGYDFICFCVYFFLCFLFMCTMYEMHNK